MEGIYTVGIERVGGRSSQIGEGSNLKKMIIYPGANEAAGWGLIAGIVLFVVILKLDYDAGWAFLAVLGTPLVISAVHSSIYSKTPPPEVVETYHDLYQLTKQSYIEELQPTIRYLGGHEAYSRPNTGGIGFTATKLVFFEDTWKKIDGWQVRLRQEHFSIPLDQITGIAHDTARNISLGKFIMFGVAAVAMQDTTNYLMINYTSSKKIANTVAFDTGKSVYHEFVNKLNVARNNFDLPMLLAEDEHQAKVRDAMIAIEKLQEDEANGNVSIEQARGMLTCPSCGSRNMTARKECWKCGKSLVTESQ